MVVPPIGRYLLILLKLIDLVLDQPLKLVDRFNLFMIKKRLLTTGELVDALNGVLSQPTINRYVRDGRLTPTATTPGGHHRWDLDDFLRQMEALRDR